MQHVGGWTYILASGKNGTLYCGVTSDLLRRVWMHKEGIASHFTRKHLVTSLVWYEPHQRIEAASQRSDLIRHRSRQWKLNFIGETNPEWVDLYYIAIALPQVPLCAFTRGASTDSPLQGSGP